MKFGQHLRLTGTALKSWFIAQVQDSIAVGLLWLIGLSVIKVPLAPLWAILATFLQFIPHFGPVLSVICPTLAALARWRDWEHPLYVLILYAVIVAIDGLFLQPFIMRRTAKIPILASILVPLLLGLITGFWGVLLAPPLLAVLYAYRRGLEKQPR
jgi:predicted PurR-regulated permease PerM